MERKVTAKYVDNYGTITFTQPLSKGRYIEEVYTKTPKGWLLMYTSNSTYHICPYDGQFRNCSDCGASDEKFDMNFCLNKRQYFSTAALVERIGLCQKAKVKVKFME